MNLSVVKINVEFLSLPLNIDLHLTYAFLGVRLKLRQISTSN